jgi:L-amino acid N-acyltransferase YncA
VIAGIVFHEFNGVNASVHVAVARPGKYLIELLRHGALYAFSHCGLRRLTGFVESDNRAALMLDYHIGFQHEATMKGAGRQGQNVEILVLRPENFRYWEVEHGRQK